MQQGKTWPHITARAALDFDAELLQVLVMLHVLLDSLVNDISTVPAIFLDPLGVGLVNRFDASLEVRKVSSYQV